MAAPLGLAEPLSVAQPELTEVAGVVEANEPVPWSDTLKVLELGSLLGMCKVPVRRPNPPGVNVTLKVVLPPGTTGDTGLAVMLKSVPFEPSMLRVPKVRLAVPVF